MSIASGQTGALVIVAVAGLIAISAQERIPLWEATNPVRALPLSPLGIDSKLIELKAAPTPQRVRLGRWLFYDKRLSADGTIACATCHHPEHAFSEPTPVSTGIRGQKGSRKAPSFINQAWTLFPQCHLGQNFTDSAFHNLGIGWNAKSRSFADEGRYLITKARSDRGAFKTPTLREVSLHPPYMHDGSLKTLRDVVQHYNKGGNKNPYLDLKVQPLNLTEDEITALVKFMEALEGEGYQDKPPTVFPK